MIKTSVIIPVYNVEAYLEECLESVFGQTQQEIEVIAIDDGSTDSSLSILRHMQEKHQNLRIITQSNHGLGYARNVGIEYAKGEFVYFIDSDDYLCDSEAFEKCYLYAKNNNLDILTFDAGIFGDVERISHNQYDRRNILPAEEIMTGKQMLSLAYERNSFVAPSWLLYISREFLCKYQLRYLTSILYEDNPFYCKIMALAERVMFLPSAFYQRRYREGSIMTSSITLKNSKSYLQVAVSVFDLYREHKTEENEIFRKIALRLLLSGVNKLVVLDESEELQELAQEMWQEALHICRTDNEEDKYCNEERLLEIAKRLNEKKIPVPYRQGNELFYCPKVSVVVPVYNVEKYVRQCVESLCTQTLFEIEIICINDGSTDNSSGILHELAESDDRIRVIDKENTGYGATVNMGIKAAKAKYIAILESDDFAVPTMYEKLYRQAENSDADIVKSNHYDYFAEENKTTVMECLKGLPYGQLLDQEERMKLVFTQPAIWCALYRRSFLLDNELFFLPTPGASYQDTSFACKTILSAKTIILLEEPLMYYRKDNMNSSVKDNNKIFCVCDEMEEIRRFIIARGNPEELAVYAKNMYLRYRWNLWRLEIEKRPAFLLMMYKAFRYASFAGGFIKKDWNDEEWEWIHRFVYSFPAMYKMLTGQGQRASFPMLSDDEIEFMILKDSSELLIYGAGIRGKWLINLLRGHGIHPKGIVVTQLEDNAETVEGLPVMDIEYVSRKMRDSLILLGVGAKLQNEVIDTMQEKYMENYLVPSKGLLALLEKEE